MRRRGHPREQPGPCPVPRRRRAAVRPGPPRPDREGQHPRQPATNHDRPGGKLIMERPTPMMMSGIRAAIMAGILLHTLLATSASAQPQMESLDRGVVAVVQDDGKVFVGWRL